MTDFQQFIDRQIVAIKEQVGSAKVICALSGGVDSSVVATLINRAVGDQQTCIFVNTGLLRQNEFEDVLEAYRKTGLNVVPIQATEIFYSKLAGITDPEEKRKIIGHEFIRIFEKEAKKIKDIKFLAQGTIKADILESVTVDGKVSVKSHHNVGGLPKDMNLELVEPLKELLKSEVRMIGRLLNLPLSIVNRQPFPGPGLAIRVIGEVTPERIATLQRADAIVREELDQYAQSLDLWQYFAVLLPVRSVGLQDDERVYGDTIIVRSISQSDGITAEWTHMPHDLLETISKRITQEITNVNRVAYDVTSKPPATIEWE